MSTKRGDGAFNPKAIPDLAGDPAKLKISRDPAKQDLQTFIHGLIVDEFDGPEPPPEVLGRPDRLRPRAVPCRLPRRRRRSPSTRRHAGGCRRGDAAGRAIVAHRAIRRRPGSRRRGAVHSRLDRRAVPVPGSKRSRAQLRAADAQLRAIQEALASAQPGRVPQMAPRLAAPEGRAPEAGARCRSSRPRCCGAAR